MELIVLGINLYNHNQIAYDKVIEQFKSTNKTCIIHVSNSYCTLLCTSDFKLHSII